MTVADEFEYPGGADGAVEADEESSIGVDEEAAEEASASARRGRIGAWLKRELAESPETTLKAIALVLGVLLIALLIYLLWFLGRSDKGGDTTPKARLEPIWQVYGPGKGDAPLFDRPMGVAVGQSSRIYVTDSGNNRVCVFDASGRFLFEFGGLGIVKPASGLPPTYAPGRLNYPVGIDTDVAGNVYVASFRNDSIEVFSPDGTPLRRFPDPNAVTGRGGSGLNGLGIAVTDVAVFQDRVYATDTYQVVVFNLNGELLDQWGKPGSGPGDLDHPNGIAVGPDGTVYVSDSNHQRVTAFTPKGEVLWQVGGQEAPAGEGTEREIDLPRGLTVLSDGSLLVTDAFGFDLVRISPDGKIVARYGERGVEPAQLNFPNDVETLRGLVLVADKENGRLQMVRLVD